MDTKKHLFRAMLMLLGVFCFASCSSDGDGGGSGTGWIETGSTSTTLRSDINTSDMETFMEYVAKLENMKLQAIKLFSKDWEGELFCGDMSKANPDKLYDLMTEMLESKDRYEKAIQQLEQSGVLSSVTTRGIYSTAAAWLYGLTDVVNDDENLIRDALERTKMMGNSTAQKQLFDALPSDCRQGYSSASEWFKDFNNGKLTNKAHKIKNAWYEMTVEVNDATLQFFENMNAVTESEGNAVWGTAAKVTKNIAQKGMDVQLSVLDKLSGGAIGTMSDVNTVMEEVTKIRQKMKDGTLKSGDLAKLQTVIGKNLLDKVLKKYLPEETKNLSEDALENIKGELADYVYDKELEASEEDAAKGTSRSIMQVINNLTTSGSAVSGVISVDSDGRVVFGLPNKDGDVNIVTRADKEQTITTVTKDGKRSTQKAKPKPGKNQVNAEPEPEDVQVELNPNELIFDSGITTAVVVVKTNIRYMKADSKDKWLHVGTNGSTNIIVTTDINEGEERHGSVLVELSQDGETIIKTLTIPVTQRSDTDTFKPQTSIDFSTFSARISPSLSYDINQMFWNYFEEEIYRNNPTTKVTKQGENFYTVTMEYADPDYWYREDWKNVPLERPYRENDPYGMYYKASFSMTITPSETTPIQDCISISHFAMSGYIKAKESDWNGKSHGYDRYISFTLATEDPFTRDPMNEASVGDRIDNLWKEYVTGFRYSNWTVPNSLVSIKCFEHRPSYVPVDKDEKGNDIYDWVENDDNEDTKTSYPITLVLKWNVPTENRELRDESEW